MSRSSTQAHPPAGRWPCISATAEGTALLVAVVPNAKHTEIMGLHDGALRMRLAAPAIEGRANDALVAWLADQLNTPRRSITLRQGATGRRKRLDIHLPPDRIERWLDTIQPAAGS